MPLTKCKGLADQCAGPPISASGTREHARLVGKIHKQKAEGSPPALPLSGGECDSLSGHDYCL